MRYLYIAIHTKGCMYCIHNDYNLCRYCVITDDMVKICMIKSKHVWGSKCVLDEIDKSKLLSNMLKESDTLCNQ